MRLRLRLIKKRGDLQRWYDVFSEIKETVLDEYLLAPLSHQNEKFALADNEESGSTKSE